MKLIKWGWRNVSQHRKQNRCVKGSNSSRGCLPSLCTRVFKLCLRKQLQHRPTEEGWASLRYPALNTPIATSAVHVVL